MVPYSHSNGTPPGRVPLAWRDIWLCHMDGAICAGQPSIVHCFLMEGPEDDWHEVEGSKRKSVIGPCWQRQVNRGAAGAKAPGPPTIGAPRLYAAGN